MSRDLAHLAFIFSFFFFSCLYWIPYFTSVLIALDDGRQRDVMFIP